MESPFGLGAYQSPPDSRDWKLAEAVPSLPETLPDSYVIPFTAFLPVWMQNKLGACVGHAWGKSKQENTYEEYKKIVPLSARFVYALAKATDGVQGEGTYPRAVAQVLTDKGICTEDKLINDTTLTHDQYIDLKAITPFAYSEALNYRINGYAWADVTEQGIKQAIYHAGENNQGIIMVLGIGDEWWTDVQGNNTWDKAKILPLRVPTTVVSGHAVYPFGYETVNGRLIIHIRNSWSNQWGDNGDGWFYFDEWQPHIKEIMTSVEPIKEQKLGLLQKLLSKLLQLVSLLKPIPTQDGIQMILKEYDKV